jgi:hypothetical protein
VPLWSRQSGRFHLRTLLGVHAKLSNQSARFIRQLAFALV